jgi:hypothetical protein
MVSLNLNLDKPQELRLREKVTKKICMNLQIQSIMLYKSLEFHQHIVIKSLNGLELNNQSIKEQLGSCKWFITSIIRVNSYLITSISITQLKIKQKHSSRFFSKKRNILTKSMKSANTHMIKLESVCMCHPITTGKTGFI